MKKNLLKIGTSSSVSMTRLSRFVLMLMLILVGWGSTAKAEITQERVTDLANLSNDAVYTLHCDANAELDRGFLAYCSQYNHAVLADVGGGYTANGVSSTADDVCVYWMIYTASSGNRFLFNIANGKFYSVNASGSAFSETALSVSVAKVTCNDAHVGSDYFEFTPIGTSNLISATPGYGKTDASQVTARTREHGATEWSVVKVSGDEITTLKNTYATQIQNAIAAIESAPFVYYVTINGAAGSVTVNSTTVTNGQFISSAHAISASDVQTSNVDGFLRTVTVSDNAITVNYYAVPRLSTGGNQHLYTLYNNNRGQYVSYRNATSNMATSKNVPDVEKASFYFTQSTTVPSTAEYLAVNIHNVAAGADMTLNAYNSWGNSEPKTWYIRRSGSAYYPNAICIAENVTGGNGLNDHGTQVADRNAADNGSAWAFEEVRETPYAGWTNLKLQNKYSNLYLAITGTSAPTASIVEEGSAGVFSIESNGSYYALKSSYNGEYYYLTTSGQWDTGNSTDPAYIWNIEETNDGYAITRKSDGKYLHSTSQTTASVYTDGTTDRNGRFWNFITIKDGGLYSIANIITNGSKTNYVEVNEDGNFALTSETATAGTKSLWVAHKNGGSTEKGTTYYFTSAYDPSKYLANGGVSTTKQTWDVSAGSIANTFALYNAQLSGGRYVAGKSDCAAFGTWGSGGHYTQGKGQWDTYSTDFRFTENTDYNVYTVSITGIPESYNAQVTVDGKTAGNGSSIVVRRALTESDVNVPAFIGYAATKTVTAGAITITYAINAADYFTTAAEADAGNYNWIRLNNSKNANRTPKASGTAEGNLPAVGASDISNANELWAFVGTKESFTIVSKTNPGYVLQTATENNAVDQNTTLVTSGSAVANRSTWKLDEQFATIATKPGFGIQLADGNNDIALNDHGGSLRFWNYDEGATGSRWTITPVEEHTITIVKDGENPYPTNTKMGKVTVTYGTTTVTTTYDVGETGARTLYLPKGVEMTLSLGDSFRGYIPSLNTETKTITFNVDPDNKAQYLFYSTDHGRPYRIPAIAKNINGELIALSDDRYCGSDIGYGRVDIVGRISTDNGVTWGDQFNVAVGDGNNNSNTCGYGDAAIVADRESNKVMMMCVSAPSGGTCWTAAQRGVISVSTDGGHTWPTPVDIKDQICNTESSLLPGVRNYFVGSGKLHQSRYIKVGDYYRVYAALWTTPDGSAINNYVIYTDDFGSTWHLLGTAGTPCVNGGNEPKCEEMPDGSVVISSRAPNKRMFNVFTYDKENNADFSKGSWDTQVNGVTNGDEHGTDGEILIVQAKKSDGTVVPVAIQSTPDHGRENVTIWYKELTENSRLSDLEGAWTRGKQVSQTSSAYSTMCIQQDRRIAFFFEEGPAGYEMVYVPFNITEITNGQYVDIKQDYSAPVGKAAEEANKELQKAGKVGYPSMSSASYRTLSDAISAAANVNGADATACKEARTAIEDALTAYYAENNITLPLRGKVYRFRGSNFKNTFDEADDEWAYLNDTNNKHVAHIAASPNANGMFMQEEASEASNWLCISADPEANEFKFVSANGNNFGYQTITEQPAVVKITRALGNQLPKVNGLAPYNNMFGFVNMKVGNTWLCAIPAQNGGAWDEGDRSNGIGGNTADLYFGVGWGDSWYYPDWRLEEVEDAGAQAYVKKYADIQLNVIGNPINSEYNALKTLVDQTADHPLNEAEEEAMFQATANYLNSMKTGYADANTADAIVLPTGYYRIRNAQSNRYLFNDKNYTSPNVNDATRMTWAASKASSYYAAHSDHNNLVWKITRHDDGVTFDIQNGQGTPMLKNGDAYTSLTFTHYNAQNHSIYFSQGLNDNGNGSEDNGGYKSGKDDGVHYIVNWAYTNDASSYWIFEPVDDKDFWTVNIYDTNANTYAMKEHTGCTAEGTAYIYNGGFAGYPAGATVDGSDISTSRDDEVAAGTLMKNITANDASKTITICFGTEMYNQTNTKHATLMTNVLNYLQYSGLGYPKATSQARRDLYKAISMCDRQYTGTGEHAVNGSLITIEYLQTCLDNFVNDVDVELPVAGHVYTFRSTVGDNNHYVVDTNDGYNINPIKGDANGFAFQFPTKNGHLQSGGYWLCTSVAANGTCIFRSAEGNWLGSNAIATSEAAAQKILFAKGNGFGNLLMRQDVSGKYMASNSDNTIGTADSPVASAAQTTDWKVSAPDMNYVYFINITSNKPRTYANQIYNVTVSMTGTVDGYKFTEKTSGAGFFVVDDAVLAPAANTTCSTNDLDNFYKNNDETVANRPTATINKTNKTIDVHYTFDYQTAIRELYSQAIDLKEHDDEFGWPKDDSPTLQRYKEDVFGNTGNNSWTDRCYDKVNNTFKGGVNQEDAYNDLANLMMQFESGVPDDEINLPQNGSSVLLTNVFTNNAVNKEYQNYLYHEDDQLKLGMTNEQKAELGFGVNIIPSEPSDAFFWVIQRDDENTVTRVEEIITGSTDYSGNDRYTITENNRVHLTAQDEIAAAAAKFGNGGFKSTESTEVGNNTTRVITTDVLVESTTTPVKTRDAATYTGGTETPEHSYISLNGNYKTRQTYGENVVERVVTETTVSSPLFYVVDGSGNVTNETTTDNTGYPVYVLDGSGNPTDVQDTKEITTTTTEYYNVERRVNMIDQVVSVQRRYPSYYISTRVGDGYIGKATGGYNNTVKTNDRDKQFNVAFVRGTKLGTVGILYMLSANDGQPRYIVGNLEGSKLDRYNTQVAYDTEKATSSNGIWSTDWNFIQARNADTHTDADNIRVNGVLVKQDGETIKHDQITESWTNPINPGHTVKFGASQSISGDVKNPVFGAPNDIQQSYASLNLPFAVDLPYEETQHIYILTALKETDYSTRKTLLLTDIKDKLLVDFNPDDDVHDYHYILPRETPVLIMNNTDVTYHYGVANAFSSYVTSEKLAEVNTALAANKFKGTLAKVDSPTGSPYILARKKATQVDGKYKGAQPYTVAFYPLAQGSYLAANKAYIDFDDIIIEPKPAGVKGAMWTIDDEVESTTDIETLVPDLIIEMDTETGEIYDIQGRKLNDAPQHGVYIQNGKKYIAK